MTRSRSGQEIRARLNHPIVDADGHSQEFLPALDEHLHKVGISADVYELLAGLMGPGTSDWARLSPSEREHVRAIRPPWWSIPTQNTLDLATVTVPGLMYERLDELGLDFVVIYPTLALGFPSIRNDELRAAACRATNSYHAELYGEYKDRITPVALIPMHDPNEAIRELEFAVEELGLKAVMIAGYVSRPIPAIAERDPALAEYARWIDTYGLDSVHDYDPFWQRCGELGVSPATHGSTMGWDARRSISNYMYNQIGHFAAAGDALCKSLFMGGVTRRFPDLRFSFLEGGVAWAATLLGDQVSHWSKRRASQLFHYDPAAIDLDRLSDLIAEHAADPGWAERSEAAGHRLGGGATEPRDDWAAAQIKTVEDLVDLFVPRFFFGCEADDPMVTTAFDTLTNPLGSRLNAMFSSDIGHWDVPDMSEVLAEAREPVDKGWMSPEDFRDFAFANAARFYTDTNPTFFEGTVIETEAAKLRDART
jgi:predicted TIM-barrel fold metal-dependent hydrolase